MRLNSTVSMKRSKYGNRRVQVGDLTFDSAKEAKRWGELQFMVKAGEIRNLERQVRFPIIVNGVKVCTYVADHVYDEMAGRVVEDVKSEFTRKDPVYRLKYKLMKACHGIDIREV